MSVIERTDELGLRDLRQQFYVLCNAVLLAFQAGETQYDELRHNMGCCWTLEEGKEDEGLLHHGECPDGDTAYRWVDWA